VPKKLRRQRWRPAAALLAGVALALTGTFTGSLAGGRAPSAYAAAIQCSVDYSVNDWGGGFTANLTITNLGEPIDGWTLTYDYTENQRLQHGWSGGWSQDGQTVTVTNPPWNTRLATNASIQIGANFSYSGTNNEPESFALNGTTCTGAHQPPSVTLTSPAPGATFTAGATVPLSATATAADGATISRVEFYNDTTLLGTDTSAPYSFNWVNVPAGDYSLHATAFDSQGASGESTPVGVHVAAGPTVVASPTALTVQQGATGTYGVRLSTQPAANVTVTTTRTSGNTGLSVATGGTLTFTPNNWSTPQSVGIRADASGTGAAGFTSTAPGHGAATVTVTQTGSTGEYEERFLALYTKITDPANGYFSKEGIPYHSVETLMVEAPDHGHETTSEAYSYLIWLQAMYGKVTGDWSRFNDAWTLTERYIIPTAADQPTNSFYNPSAPATYAAEHDLPSSYPSQIDSSVPVGQDPIAGELESAYGTDHIYGMHWLQDVDNVYGFGNTPGGGCELGRSTNAPSYINTYQRGSQESVFETIPQPTCDRFAFGGPNGYLDLFIRDSSYARQWKYTNAPDADARAVQAAYWAGVWAQEQGKGGDVSATLAKAAKMGDYLRYSFFDKYFKRIGNCTSPTGCPAATGKASAHYLLSWFYAWGGANDTSAGWAWRIGDGASHFGYQNPLAAHALANDARLRPRSATAVADWQQSLQRQLEFYRWLQSAEGAIAGGATNSWGGAYRTPPAGTPTFYGMYYDWQPVYHDPPSNQWFGFQAWSMERVAEYYNVTGNATAKTVLDKWVRWALANTRLNPDGTYQIPSTLQWSGQPDTWNPASPGANAGLHVTVADFTNDVGVAAAYAKTLAYYAARSGDTAARTTAKGLLDGMWNNHQDGIGISVPETKADYRRLVDPVYVPLGWTGTMPNGDRIDSNSTFISIRSWYRQDPSWSRVQAYLDGGAAPVFNYHRFWAQADIALAMAAYGQLFDE